MTEKSKKDDEFLILSIEAAMSIINIQTRKQTLRKGLYNRMMDEKGMLNLIHKRTEQHDADP